MTAAEHTLMRGGPPRVYPGDEFRDELDVFDAPVECSCKWLSDPLPTTEARRQAHARHVTEEQQSDDLVTALADEITGINVGTGYYATSISMEAALEAIHAVLARTDLIQPAADLKALRKALDSAQEEAESVGSMLDMTLMHADVWKARALAAEGELRTLTAAVRDAQPTTTDIEET